MDLDAEGEDTLDDNDPIEPDFRVVIGQLDNGLTYYIRPNYSPPNRADFWLAVNAGSVLETHTEKGVAHFVEHMLFNGTRNFPGQDLINFLEKMGVEFGPDVNAYTSFDETVYQLQVPADDPELVKTALDVLRDWAGNALFDAAELDAERNVIVEEWRLRDQTASGRIGDQQYKLLLEGSQYAQRLPIGDMDTIRSISPDAVRAFYEKWYRPDLMAVVAVGDFDIEEIESLIQERFGDLPKPSMPEPRPVPSVPPHDETRYLVASDPENPYAYALIMNRVEHNPVHTYGEYQQMLARQLVSQMLSRRLDEIRQQPDAPFSAGFAGASDLVRGVDTFLMFAQTGEADVLDGVAALLTESERVMQHGFTDAELEQARSELLRRLEDQSIGSGNLGNAYLASEFIRHYMTDEAMPGIEAEYILAQDFLPKITLEQVNKLGTALLSASDRTIIVVTPEKENLAMLQQADVEAAVARVSGAEVTPYAGQAARDQIMDTIPTPAAIVSEQTFADLGTTEIVLANGTHVVMRPSFGIEDQVLIASQSPGGASLVPDSDYAEAVNAPDIVTQSGIGALDQAELSKLLSRKVVRIWPYISELAEGFVGSASPEDLETAFQMIYLYATQPHAEPAALAALQSRQRAELSNRDLDPEVAYEEAITAARCGTGIRCGSLPLAEIESLDLQRVLEVYRDRFSDLGDSRWVITGDFDLNRVKRLAQTYLGTLPAGGRQEHWRNVVAAPSPEDAGATIYQGQAERSLASLLYTGDTDTTLRTRLRLRVLEKILDIRLREVIREERGGSYSPYAVASISREPTPRFSVRIAFTADPQRVQELQAAARQLVDEVRSEGPSADNLTKAKEQLARNYEVDSQGNSYWLETLLDSDSHLNAARIALRYQTVLNGITAEEIQQAAQDFLRDDHLAQIVLYPTSYRPTP